MLRMDPDRYLKISRESIIRAGLKLEEEKKVMVGTGNVDEMKQHKSEGLVVHSFQSFLYVTTQNCTDTYLRVSVQSCI